MHTYCLARSDWEAHTRKHPAQLAAVGCQCMRAQRCRAAAVAAPATPPLAPLMGCPKGCGSRLGVPQWPFCSCAGDGGDAAGAAAGAGAGEEMHLEHTDEASAAAAAKLRQQQRSETVRCVPPGVAAVLPVLHGRALRPKNAVRLPSWQQWLHRGCRSIHETCCGVWQSLSPISIWAVPAHGMRCCWPPLEHAGADVAPLTWHAAPAGARRRQTRCARSRWGRTGATTATGALPPAARPARGASLSSCRWGCCVHNPG